MGQGVQRQRQLPRKLATLHFAHTLRTLCAHCEQCAFSHGECRGSSSCPENWQHYTLRTLCAHCEQNVHNTVNSVHKVCILTQRVQRWQQLPQKFGCKLATLQFVHTVFCSCAFCSCALCSHVFCPYAIFSCAFCTLLRSTVNNLHCTICACTVCTAAWT